MMLARSDHSVCMLIGFKPGYKITSQNTACLVGELSPQTCPVSSNITEPPS